jgi:recombination protein RecT
MSNDKAIIEPTTVKGLLATESYKGRFYEVLGKRRAEQFMASVVQISNLPGLADCEPKSIIAAAFNGATLDLPVEIQLGFAHVIGYADKKSGKKKAQFQIGYKGYIQLAMRSGQYRRMNAFAVNADAYGGVDEFMEPIINAALIDETKPAVGYCFMFEMVNGFKKAAYWTKEKVLAHAKQYSRSYQNGYGPWFDNFPAQAIKTVIANTLKKWAILSKEMQQALVVDQASQDDIDMTPQYVDGVPDRTIVTVDAQVMPDDKNAAPGAVNAADLMKPEKPAQPKVQEHKKQAEPAKPAPAKVEPPKKEDTTSALIAIADTAYENYLKARAKAGITNAPARKPDMSKMDAPSIESTIKSIMEQTEAIESMNAAGDLF